MSYQLTAWSIFESRSGLVIMLPSQLCHGYTEGQTIPPAIAPYIVRLGVTIHSQSKVPPDCLWLVPPRFTPILPFCAPQAEPIGPNHAQLCPMSLPCHIPCCGQNLAWNASQQPIGFGLCPQLCGHHLMITQPHATQPTSSVSLGPEGPNPLFFTSRSILLHADTSLVAPQCQEWAF